jgi:hypothetical protein
MFLDHCGFCSPLSHRQKVDSRHPRPPASGYTSQLGITIGFTVGVNQILASVEETYIPSTNLETKPSFDDTDVVDMAVVHHC